MSQWLNENIDEFGALEFRVKFRARLDAGNWKRQGEQLYRDCGKQDHPVLLVIDDFLFFLRGCTAMMETRNESTNL